MNSLKMKKNLYHKTPLKILSFLSIHSGQLFSAQEIAKEAKSSKGATNQTLRILLELCILSREQKGNLFLYKLNFDNFILKQFKIFENLLGLQQLIRNIQPYCSKIILFGSCAAGLNFQESDIDLFIKSEYKNQVREFINQYDTVDSKIRPVIQNHLEILTSRKTDKVFFEQVKKGIILWEGEPIYEEI